METDNNTDMNADNNSILPAKELTIGQLLLKTREEKGLSLKTISQQTKIHIGLLESLEKDQFDKLPSKAYVRGFVKSAAKILSLDQEYTLSLLEKAYENSPKKDESTNVEIKNETARNTLTTMTSTPLETVKSVTASSSIFMIKAAIGIVIIGAIGINVKNYLERTREEPVKLPEVLSTHQKKKAPPKPAQKVEETKPTQSQEPIQVNIIQDKNVKSEVTIKDVTLKPISIGERQLSDDKSLTKEQIDELLPAKYRITPTKGMETLFLNASEGDSWLTYKVDDKDIKKFVLRQGRTLFLRGQTIRIFIGNTKSLKAFHNNKPVNLSNDKNSVRNLVLPEEAKTKFHTPLFIFQPDGTVLTSDEFMQQNMEKKPETSTATPATEITPLKPTPAKP